MHKLVQRAQNGDKNAFVKLMQAHKADMYRLGKGYFRSDHDIADALSETILTCYENIGNLREPRFFRAWLMRIFCNKCNDMKRRGRHYAGEEALPDRAGDDADTANAEFLLLMDSLEEPYRIVLILYYAQRFRVREIAEITGLSESAVKTRLKRGRDKMRDVYNACLEGTI